VVGLDLGEPLDEPRRSSVDEREGGNGYLIVFEVAE
jgi:hypothetical protein